MVLCVAVITRKHHLVALRRLLERFPVVAVLGARQVGKTTLTRAWLGAGPRGSTRFDLENPAHLARLADPMLALEGLSGVVVLDEIQRRPELFPVLRVLADRRPLRARYVLLGSASPALLRQSSESLAGRIAYYELPGLSVREVGLTFQRGLGGVGDDLRDRVRVWSCFQQQHPQVRVLREPRGEHAAGGAGADHDDIGFILRHVNGPCRLRGNGLTARR